MKICIDPGHGGKDSGAIGYTKTQEKDHVLEIAKLAGKYADIQGFDVIYTRTTDKYLSLAERAEIANENNCDIFVSIHNNSYEDPKAHGIETWSYPGSIEGLKISKIVQAEMIKASGLTDRGSKTANFGVLRRTNMPAVLVEIGFISNPDEEQLIMQKDFKDKMAKAIIKGVCEYFGTPWKELEETDNNKVAIMGEAAATIAQMKEYLLNINPNPDINCTIDELVNYFIEEGKIEGVRGDIAFAQAIKETGYFRYGGIVEAHQNNFAGIGALNNNAKGQAAIFPTPQIGVRAQIQHLKGYASTESLKQEVVDPRYQILVDNGLLGTAQYVTNLNGKWAWPGRGYGEDILQILDKILQIVIEVIDYKALYEAEVKKRNILEEEMSILQEQVNILEEKLNKVKNVAQQLNDILEL